MSPQTWEEHSVMITRTGFKIDWYAKLSYIVTMCTIINCNCLYFKIAWTIIM